MLTLYLLQYNMRQAQAVIFMRIRKRTKNFLLHGRRKVMWAEVGLPIRPTESQEMEAVPQGYIHWENVSESMQRPITCRSHTL